MSDADIPHNSPTKSAMSGSELTREETQSLPNGMSPPSPKPIHDSASHDEPFNVASERVDRLRQRCIDLGLDSRGNKHALKVRLRKHSSKPNHVHQPEGQTTENGQQGNEERNAEDIDLDRIAAGTRSLTVRESTLESDGLSDVERILNARRNLGRKQPFDWYLVFDVEATCDKVPDYPNEIIEFPVVLVCGRTLDIVDEFHSYVKPTGNPTLSEFCVSLTGIQQSTVDSAPPFTVVLQQFEQWLSQYLPHPFQSASFLTDGPWDLRDFMRKQCARSGIKRPPYMRRWVDLRRTFSKIIQLPSKRRPNLASMLKHYNMDFDGRPHSGIDDARNIARLALHMMRSGIKFPENGTERDDELGPV